MSALTMDAERAVFVQLEQLVRNGELRLDIDRRKLTHMDFPLASEADGNLIMFPSLAICIAVFWEFGVAAGALALAASFVVYQTLGKQFIGRRIRARILDRGLTELDVWRKVWRFGGVILSTADGSTTCQGPEQSWTHFVREIAGRSRHELPKFDNQDCHS